MSNCQLCHAAYHLSSLSMKGELLDRDCREKQIATRLHELHEAGGAAAEWAIQLAVFVGESIEEGTFKP